MRVAFVLALAAAAPAAAQVPSEAEQRARWERGRAQQQQFERRQFAEAGFAPVVADLAEARELRRLLLSAPYGMLPLPGLELVRYDDGRVSVRLQYRGWSSGPVAVDKPGAWDALASRDEALFAEPVFRPITEPPPPVPPPPICHAWLARFENEQGRTANWSGCGGGTPGPGYSYAVAMIEIAMAARPECGATLGDPFGAFHRCFGPTPALDDPELEARFAALRKEYEEASATDAMTEARRALEAPGLTLGGEAWLAARDAIKRFKEVHDLRRDRLLMVQQLYTNAVYLNSPAASDADVAKLRQTLEVWKDSLSIQDRYYAELLQRLASADE